MLKVDEGRGVGGETHYIQSCKDTMMICEKDTEATWNKLELALFKRDLFPNSTFPAISLE